MRKKAGVLGLVLAAALLTACGGNNKGGTDTAYPFTWKEAGDGSLEVTISGELEEGYSWSADSSGQFAAAQTEDGFTISPEAEGAFGVVTFTCQSGGTLPNQIFQITLSLETNEKGKLQVSDSWSTELEGNESAGEGTDYPYQWKTDENGNLLVYVTTSDRTWQVSTEVGSEDVWLSALGPNYDENGFLVTISGTAPAGTVYLRAAESQAAILLDIDIDSDGQITLSNHAEEAWVQSKEEISGVSELEAQFGTLTIPEQRYVTECRTSVWNDGVSVNAVTGTVCFTKDGAEWSYLAADNLPLETLMSEILDETCETQIGESAGREVTVSVFPNGGAAAFWQEDNGRVFALNGNGDLSAEDMLEEAANWIGVY